MAKNVTGIEFSNVEGNENLGKLTVTFEDGSTTSSMFNKIDEPKFAISEEIFLKNKPIKSEILRGWVSDRIAEGQHLRADGKYATPYERPTYYESEGTNMDVIDVCNKLGLNFTQGNILKYIFRAGKKEGQSELKDLGKAKNYLLRLIQEAEQRHGVTVDEVLNKETEKRAENK